MYWFCRTSTSICHRCTHVLHPEPPPRHLPPHTIPLGHPRAPAPSFLYPASNLDWQFVSYIIFKSRDITLPTKVRHEPSSLLPPHTIPLGHPRAPAPSILYPASNLDWRLVSYMILHMFQCHSPKSSPHPSPIESKRLFYTSVSLFCLTYMVIVTFFLNSIYIYVSILYWCFSFWLTSLCIIGSSFHLPH